MDTSGYGTNDNDWFKIEARWLMPRSKAQQINSISRETTTGLVLGRAPLPSVITTKPDHLEKYITTINRARKTASFKSKPLTFPKTTPERYPNIPGTPKPMKKYSSDPMTRRAVGVALGHQMVRDAEKAAIAGQIGYLEDVQRDRHAVKCDTADDFWRQRMTALYSFLLAALEKHSMPKRSKPGSSIKFGRNRQLDPSDRAAQKHTELISGLITGTSQIKKGKLVREKKVKTGRGGKRDGAGRKANPANLDNGEPELTKLHSFVNAIGPIIRSWMQVNVRDHPGLYPQMIPDGLKDLLLEHERDLDVSQYSMSAFVEMRVDRDVLELDPNFQGSSSSVSEWTALIPPVGGLMDRQLTCCTVESEHPTMSWHGFHACLFQSLAILFREIRLAAFGKNKIGLSKFRHSGPPKKST